MGVRDALTGQLYLVLKELVTLKDGPRDERYRSSKDASWERARQILRAWETHDPGVLGHCSPASRARAGDTSANDNYNDNDIVNDNDNDKKGVEDVIDDANDNVIDNDIAELYETWIEVLEELRGGIYPNPARVRKTPGPRLVKILFSALAESSLDECKAAIRGAYIYWTNNRIPSKTLSDVFTTYRNTGSLSSRITWLADLAGYGSDQNRGLDAPGVRDRLHDVRRMIRACLDLPDTPSSRRRLAEATDWLNAHGMDLRMSGDGAFEIVPHP